MDVSQTSASSASPAPERAGADRAAALAEARHRAGAAQLQSAAENRERQSEQLARVRDAVARAIGANTDISIRRADAAPIFLYQAIDKASGEVVKEWPHARFVEMLNTVAPGMGDDLAGLILDRQA